MQEDYADAWQRYLKLVNCGGTKTYSQLIAVAGFDSPFGDEALRKVAEAAEKWLDSHPIAE